MQISTSSSAPEYSNQNKRKTVDILQEKPISLKFFSDPQVSERTLSSEEVHGCNLGLMQEGKGGLDPIDPSPRAQYFAIQSALEY